MTVTTSADDRINRRVRSRFSGTASAACSGVPSLITKKQIYNLYTYILYSYVFSERRDSLPACFFSYTASAAAAS